MNGRYEASQLHGRKSSRYRLALASEFEYEDHSAFVNAWMEDEEEEVVDSGGCYPSTSLRRSSSAPSARTLVHNIRSCVSGSVWNSMQTTKKGNCDTFNFRAYMREHVYNNVSVAQITRLLNSGQLKRVIPLSFVGFREDLIALLCETFSSISGKNRNSCTVSLLAEAVVLIVSDGISLSESSRRLDICETTIRNYLRIVKTFLLKTTIHKLTSSTIHIDLLSRNRPRDIVARQRRMPPSVKRAEVLRMTQDEVDEGRMDLVSDGWDERAETTSSLMQIRQPMMDNDGGAGTAADVSHHFYLDDHDGMMPDSHDLDVVHP